MRRRCCRCRGIRLRHLHQPLKKQRGAPRNAYPRTGKSPSSRQKSGQRRKPLLKRRRRCCKSRGIRLRLLHHPFKKQRGAPRNAYAVSGNFSETVGALTLSANSTIDFAGFVGTLRFSGIGSWASGANLAIWNWSGTTQYGTQINNYNTPSNLVFSNNSTLTSNLANISFYSDSANSFVGSGFEVTGFSGGGSQIIAVPETETYFYAVALLAGVVVQYLRRRAKRKPDEDHLPAFATCATARQCDRLPR